MFDNVLELLVLTGRSLPQAMSMLIPEPWQDHESMPDDLKAYYEYQACLIEPWDGPASMAFTDGTVIGALLDRNGLRPSRYWVTKGGLVVMASEAGVLEHSAGRGRIERPLAAGPHVPGRHGAGRIIADDEIKHSLASQHPYRAVAATSNLLTLDDLPDPIGARSNGHLDEPLMKLQRAFGYTLEDLRILMAPMATDGQEADRLDGQRHAAGRALRPPAAAVQLFQAVVRPGDQPAAGRDSRGDHHLDGHDDRLGRQPAGRNARAMPAVAARSADSDATPTWRGSRQLDSHRALKSRTLSTLFPRSEEGRTACGGAWTNYVREASQAIAEGVTILILSDRGVNAEWVPIPALLATSGVHHHLIREETRTRCGLVIEIGRTARSAALRPAHRLRRGRDQPVPGVCHARSRCTAEGYLPTTYTIEKLEKNYIKAVGKGLLKVMSKMGISTQQSYRGRQIFEAVGLNSRICRRVFHLDRHPHRRRRHRSDCRRGASPARARLSADAKCRRTLDLDVGGQYQWRRKGEAHIFSPDVIAKLQHRHADQQPRRIPQVLPADRRAAAATADVARPAGVQRPAEPVPLEEVEPATEIVKRFATGAMSYGSISKEAHETLAIAMNRMGGKSNTGEGGEDPARYMPDANGDRRSSAIKQVASGRFGVTSEYLVSARNCRSRWPKGPSRAKGASCPATRSTRKSPASATARRAWG